MIEVGTLAEPRLVKGPDRPPSGVGRVGVGRVLRLRFRLGLALAVKLAEVMVEGAVLLHQHHDVVDRDLCPVRGARRQGVGRKRAGPEGARWLGLLRVDGAGEKQGGENDRELHGRLLARSSTGVNPHYRADVHPSDRGCAPARAGGAPHALVGHASAARRPMFSAAAPGGPAPSGT